jgi:hypothetical protein
MLIVTRLHMYITSETTGQGHVLEADTTDQGHEDVINAGHDGFFVLEARINDCGGGDPIDTRRIYIPWQALNDEERTVLEKTSELFVEEGDGFKTDQTRHIRPVHVRNDKQWKKIQDQNAEMKDADTIDQILDRYFPQLKKIKADSDSDSDSDEKAQVSPPESSDSLRPPVPFTCYGNGSVRIYI